MAALEEDRLSDLPEAILLHILSMLDNSKQVVRTSVLSSRFRFLYKSVPASLNFIFPKYPYHNNKIKTKHILAYVATVNRELHYWRSTCDKIKAFSVYPYKYYGEFIVHDVDFWIHFATNIANVEEFVLKFCVISFPDYAYNLPEFAYRNVYLRHLVLGNCMLSPCGNVEWSNLVTLYIGDVVFMEGVMEKVLLGCPNLECLELYKVGGICRLVIEGVKLWKLVVTNYETDNADEDVCRVEIFAPNVRHLELFGLCCDEMRFELRNVDSLVTAVLSLNVDFFDVENGEDKLEMECRYLQELLQSVAHVKNLELGPWCIEFLSILELKGWPFPSSSWKYLKLNAALEQLDYPGICSFLLSSSDLETLVVDWCSRKPRRLLTRYTNEDEQSKRLEALRLNCSLPHLKTIKFINFYGPLSENKFVLPFVKCLYKNTTVPKKFALSGKFRGSNVSRNHVDRSS